jgi:hypothetical protein
MHSPAIFTSGNSFMNAASVFNYLDPQEHMFAPNEPWQQPQTKQHIQHNQLLCPWSPSLEATCSDFWPEVCSDSLDLFEPISTAYVPPISPSILIQFLMSPDYSMLQSNTVASSQNLLGHLSGQNLWC